jgi:sarcosine oxidase subunit gamma
MTAPDDFPRRSFLYRKLAEAGAVFEALERAAVARHFGDPAGEAAAARRLGLADLSPLARTGFKGAGTPEWLAGQGVTVPEASNRAARQAGGGLAARLAPSELLILGAIGDGAGGQLCETLEAAWAAETLPPATPRGFPLPRRDSHAWFLVAGAEAAVLFAKLCGVDLRPGKFEDLAIAQTSVARLSAIVIRDDIGAQGDGQLAYHLLCDSASAAYLWDCLIDAMAEFDGGPVGLDALRSLAGG